MQPWLHGRALHEKQLQVALKVLSLKRSTRKEISLLIDDYIIFGGHLIWPEEKIPDLQTIIMEVLGIDNKVLMSASSSDDMRKTVQEKTLGFNNNSIEEICYVLTYIRGIEENDD